MHFKNMTDKGTLYKYKVFFYCKKFNVRGVVLSRAKRFRLLFSKRNEHQFGQIGAIGDEEIYCGFLLFWFFFFFFDAKEEKMNKTILIKKLFFHNKHFYMFTFSFFCDEKRKSEPKKKNTLLICILLSQNA